VTLTKNKMVREIGRRTRLKNRDVELMLETLIAVWTESLVVGERIELENFMALEVKEIDRGTNSGTLFHANRQEAAPRVIRRVRVRLSKRLKSTLVR
jgi:nucleoid DNA-binding protein